MGRVKELGARPELDTNGERGGECSNSLEFNRKSAFPKLSYVFMAPRRTTSWFTASSSHFLWSLVAVSGLIVPG